MYTSLTKHSLNRKFLIWKYWCSRHWNSVLADRCRCTFSEETRKLDRSELRADTYTIP